MRKWMRERLQRRKKKSDESASQPAPPPLQPAYFENEPESGPAETEAGEAKVAATGETEFEAQPEPAEAGSEPGADAESAERPRSSRAAASAARGRGRRRRGGRGRSGRGREQAVAQAFAPTAAKGTIPEIPPEEAAAPANPAEVVEEAAASEAEAPAPVVEAAAAETPKLPAAPVAAQRPPKGIVVLAIGLPGSGKSSWFKRHNVTPLSSDMVRALLFDDIREQRYQDLVFSNLRAMLKARLIAKRPMNYVDATNLTPHERQHWVKLAKDFNYEVHAVFFDVPLEVCIERHQRRDRVVPEEVMRRMAAKFKPPSFAEGFAKITVVRVKKKEEPGDAG